MPVTRRAVNLKRQLVEPAAAPVSVGSTTPVVVKGRFRLRRALAVGPLPVPPANTWVRAAIAFLRVERVVVIRHRREGTRRLPVTVRVLRASIGTAVAARVPVIRRRRPVKVPSRPVCAAPTVAGPVLPVTVLLPHRRRRQRQLRRPSLRHHRPHRPRPHQVRSLHPVLPVPLVPIGMAVVA